MQQIKIFKTITAFFLLLLCPLSLASCESGADFAFVTDAYSTDIIWEYGGHSFCAELYVGELSERGREIHMLMKSPQSLAGMALTHNAKETVLRYGGLTLGRQMCARYLEIAQSAVPTGGLKHLSKSGRGDVYVDADGRWWYFDKGSSVPSALEFNRLRITFKAFECKSAK